MPRSIRLRRSAQARQAVPNQGLGFRLKITAVTASGLPTAIFGYQRVAVAPHDPELYKDEFLFVCSPYDLTLYPEGAPDDTQSPAFFRKDEIDVVVASQTVANELWNAVKQEVCVLIDALNAMDVLVTAEDFVCGEEDSEDGDSEASQDSE